MANPLIVTQIGSADPNAAPITVNDLIDLLNQLITSEMTGSYIPYVLGHDTPGVDDRDKAWIELDTGGRPVNIKTFYNGNWRRVYNGMLGEITLFSGDPTIAIDWDDNGRGVAGGKYDGWQICNGNNGSPNLTDKFIVAAHMDDSGGHNGYNNGWQTFVDGISDKKTGGANSFTLTLAEVPRPARTEVDVYRWSADVNTPNNTGDLYGVRGGGQTPTSLLDADAGNTAPTKVNLVPPFYALAYMIFIGYA